MSVADILSAARGKSPAAKPKPEPKPKPAASAPASAEAKDMSVADILAAARGSGAPAKTEKPPAANAAAKAKADPDELSVADVLAAARKPKSAEVTPSITDAMEAGREKNPDAQSASKPTATPSPSKGNRADMSVADILAAARAGAAGGKKVPAKAGGDPTETSAPAESESTPTAPGRASSASSDASLPVEVADILAYCRRVDGS